MKEIVDTARALSVELRAAMRATEKSGLSEALVRRWEELEFLRMDWPEAHGGFGVSRMTKITALEALAHGDAAAALALDRESWVCSPLLQLESCADRVAERLSDSDAARRCRPAVWVDHDGGDLLGRPIDGLPGGPCDSLFVLADRRLSCFVDVEVTPYRAGALQALGQGSATLTKAPLWTVELSAQDASALLGTWQLYLSATLLGLADAAAEETRSFCMDRVAFGKKVAHHQAIAFIIADMEIQTSAARELVLHAAETGVGRTAHAAFLEASACALFVTNYAVQLLGSHGYVEDYPVEKWMREARAISLMAGGSDGARQRLGEAIASEWAPVKWMHTPEHLADALQKTRQMGEQYLRPLGLEADAQGGPHPPDHPFYQWYVDSGQLAEAVEAELTGDRFGGDKWAARRIVLTMEETAHWDRGMAVSLPGPGLGGPTVMAIGTEEQRRAFLHPFLDRSRPRWAAFGMTEPNAGSDVARISTRCHKDGDEWVLNGNKSFCSNSPRADWVIIYATVDATLGRKGHRVFVVPPSTPGFETPRLEKKMGLKAYETASFALEDCRVPASALLGGEAAYEGSGGKAGFKSAMKAFEMSRPGMAAMAIGIGRAAYERALEVLKERFGKAAPSVRSQRLVDRVGEMERKLHAGFLLCWRAATLLDHGEPAALAASKCKAYAAGVALEVCSLAMEVLGDSGSRSDQLVEKLFRDVKALDIVEGTGQIQRLIIARQLVDLPRS